MLESFDALSHCTSSRKRAHVSAIDSSITSLLVLPQTKEDFPGTTKKLVDDIKTAGWEGGKVRPCCLPLCVMSSARCHRCPRPSSRVFALSVHFARATNVVAADPLAGRTADLARCLMTYNNANQ